MPRNYKLTWQPGVGGRGGRWRKKYRGRTYHFPGGRGKTDRESYEAAVSAWEATKRQVDANAPKPHQHDYEKTIQEWEQVLQWCRKHGDEEVGSMAVEKIAVLRAELSRKEPQPVLREDTFAGHFDEATRFPGRKEAFARIADAVLAAADRSQPFESIPESHEFHAAFERFRDAIAGNGSPGKLTVVPAESDSFDLDPLKTERAIWTDRIEVMQRDAAQPERTVESFVRRFLDDKSAAVTAEELSAVRCYTLQLHLGHFADWLGQSTPVDDIAGQTLLDYRRDLLKMVEAESWTRTTANGRLASVKSFVNWLWQIEAIQSLPRIMNGRSAALNIGTSSSQIIVFTKSEISTLLQNASNRTKLYVLLMLNCGMTQKDIADLKHSEVNWDAGRIIRKRSKTRKHESVPEVGYALWPETLRLLKAECSEGEAELVLLNENGEPIRRDEVTAEGKYKKNDNVKNAFDRLCRKTKIKKPLKSLKKTSASLIRGNSKYASLESLFLGHSMKTIAHRHYALPPQDLLDQAIGWLAGEYGLS